MSSFFVFLAITKEITYAAGRSQKENSKTASGH